MGNVSSCLFCCFLKILNPSLSHARAFCKKKSLTSLFLGSRGGTGNPTFFLQLWSTLLIHFCFRKKKRVVWLWWWSWIFVVALLLGICDRFRSVRALSRPLAFSVLVPQPNRSLCRRLPGRFGAARRMQAVSRQFDDVVE